MRILSAAIICCTALVTSSMDLPAQPADLSAQPPGSVRLMLPVYQPPRPSPWGFGVCGGYSLAIQEGFTAPAHDGLPEESFPLGIGHGFNVGISMSWWSSRALSLVSHVVYERRPLSMEKSVEGYDAIDADGRIVSTSAMRRVDLRYDMIDADLLYMMQLAYLRPGFIHLLAGPSFGYLLNGSLKGGLTVPGSYRSAYSGDHVDDGRTVIFDETPGGFNRFRVGIAAGVMFEVWEPWSDRRLALGVLADYGVTRARSGAAWKVHGVRLDLEWRYGVFKPVPPYTGEDNPL